MDDVDLKRKKILIVDDEPDLLEIISSEFDLLDSIVFQADSIEKAIQILKSHSIDVVISDVRLPHKTGIDLLKFIKNKNPIHPPVILMSGYTDASIQEIYNLGAEGFLAKPFRLEELILTTSRLLKTEDLNVDLFQDDKLIEIALNFNFNLIEAIEKKAFSIGRGGCSFLIPYQTEIPLNQNEFVFSIQFQNIILKGSGWARWSEHDSKSNSIKIGLEFHKLDSESHKIIKEYINRHTIIPYIPHLK
jgi:CheY-like chemotaxis protein